MINAHTSVADTFELVWADDPALNKEDPEFAGKLERAQDGTASWTECCLPGQQPTVFVARALPGSIRREMQTLFNGTALGLEKDAALVFSLSIKEIRNLPGVVVAFGKHPSTGWPILQDAVINALDRVSPAIVTEVGWQAFSRMALRPKQ